MASPPSRASPAHALCGVGLLLSTRDRLPPLFYGPVMLPALAFPAAPHALAQQFAARLGHHGPLARGHAVVEVNHDPVLRLSQAMGQSGVREQGPVAPAA